MRNAVSGVLAACAAIALCGTASAQSTSQYDYNANYGGATTVAPSTSYVQPSTSTYAAPAASTSYQGNYATTSQPMPSIGYNAGSGSYAAPTTNATQSYAAPSTGSYAAQTSQSYTPPAATSYAPSVQSYGQTMTTYTDQGTSYAQPSASQPGTGYGMATAGSYAAPAIGTSGYTTPSYAAQSAFGSTLYGQTGVTPGYAAQTGYPSPVPATAYTPPAASGTTLSTGAIAPTDDVIQDDDRWSSSLPRYYPAIQACLRRSTAKNPVVANVQESGNQTVMLIGEGGSSNYSVCKTGLTGTTVKANTDTRPIPPAFFAPLGSTFTVAPDRPFQPVVDTDQKVIGWIVRTQPARVPFGQYGSAPGFDGQFIPPMMVNTSVGQG